nr:GTPase [Cellulomonas sp. APG4]
MSLGERLDALTHALAAGRDVLPDDVVARAREIEERAGHRLRLSDEHTVVALAGATGSGKSSLLNALVGSPLATVDVLRPTTSETLAVVRGTGAGELLDWLGVRSRHLVDEADATAEVPGGLVLLDLPDHDSVRTEHRLEAERLVALVDLMVWVVDPQKYADAAIHERYLRGLARHRDVLLVVLNQTDRLEPGERSAVERDLSRLLADDGLAGVPVLGLSARTGSGVGELRDRLAEAARRRRAARARTEADVADVAAHVLAACGETTSVPGRARTELVAALERAAGLPVVVDAVGASWRRRGREATGWPPTRWLARMRPDPLRRLHLGASADPEVARSSLPATGAAEHARARGAVRAYTQAAAAGLPEDWALAVHEAADTTPLPDALDHAVASTSLGVEGRAGWWRGVDLLQWLLVLVMLAGLAWWAVLAVAERLAVPLPAPPTWGEVPWPTVALLGGALLGLLMAGVARLAVAAGARRRARRAHARLRTAVGEVADRLVVEPVDAVRDRHAACREAALRAVDGRG